MDGLEPKKLALLRVLQILWEDSDIDHPLHQGRIVELLESKYGITVERKAIGRNCYGRRVLRSKTAEVGFI